MKLDLDMITASESHQQPQEPVNAVSTEISTAPVYLEVSEPTAEKQHNGQQSAQIHQTVATLEDKIYGFFKNGILQIVPAFLTKKSQRYLTLVA